MARWLSATFACGRCRPAPPAKHELQAADFNFRGPLGSDGARLAQVDADHFLVTLGHAPTHPDLGEHGAVRDSPPRLGNRLRLDVRFDIAGRVPFDDYPRHGPATAGTGGRSLGRKAG